jgi:N-acetylglucosamine-6-phosphate deacetylase
MLQDVNRGYFDLQVNGYGGVDFNQDDLSADALHRSCLKLREDGVGGILATIITEQLPVMQNRLRRLVALRAEDSLARELIRGIHIEGPFLSTLPGYAGAHPRDALKPATVDAVQGLLEAAGGLAQLVTLAPECDAGFKTTRYLADRGIVVSAGHTDASIDELRGAIDAGMSMVTHLGNGCPGELSRHNNIIQRALSLRDKLWLCFIADGVHVPFFALGNYLKLARERAIVVTDAMSAAGLGPGIYTLGRWQMTVDENLAAWAPNKTHLLGSAVTMRRAAENLRKHVALADEEVDQLTRARAEALFDGLATR